MKVFKIVLSTVAQLGIMSSAYAGQTFMNVTDQKLIAAQRAVIIAEVEMGNVDTSLPLVDLKDNNNYEITSLHYYVNSGSCDIFMEVHRKYDDGSGPSYRYDIGQLTDDVSYGSKCFGLRDENTLTSGGKTYSGKGLYSRENAYVGIYANSVYRDPRRIPTKVEYP
jgi:hypothetical protein